MDTTAFDTLAKTLVEAGIPPENVLADEPMANHTTFCVGGPADACVRARGAEDVTAARACARAAGVPCRILGRGSDVLVADAGLRGLVVEVGALKSAIAACGTALRVQAGATNEQVAHAALAAGLAGYEFASGIPGTIGGAAIMNAGAYDGEFKDVATSVTCLFPDDTARDVPVAEADWSYRHSMMGDAGLVVVAVTLRLRPDDPADIRARMDDLAQRRASKQPLELPSAGSTFKRPTGHFAGKLIQDSGMQGHRVGGAQVSTKHAGFVVNTGGATAADVRQVIADVQQAVKAQFGVALEPEVKFWGFDD